MQELTDGSNPRCEVIGKGDDNAKERKDSDGRLGVEK